MDRNRINTLLQQLYGSDGLDDLAGQIQNLAEKHELGTLRAKRPPSRLSRRDVVLIVYPDQIQEPGKQPLDTLADFAEHHLPDTFSALHVLPFYPSTSDDGFSPTDYLAVQPEWGDWEQISRLRRSFDLMFDGVFNHVSAQGAWFREFLQEAPDYRDFFITAEDDADLSKVIRPRALPLIHESNASSGPKKVWTTFSADQVDLNYRNPRVLLAVLDALLFYVSHGARFIRLGAAAYLWKEPGTPCLHLPQTHAIIQLMRAVLDEVAPNTRLITETKVPHAPNTSYFGDGSNEAHMVYNFALPPLVWHALQKGDSTVLSRWAASLQPPSDQTTFFNFLASHDGICLDPVRDLLSGDEMEKLLERTRRQGGLVSLKNNPDGTQSPYELNINYFDALNDPSAGEPQEMRVNRFLVAHSIMLSLAGVPGIYFHSLFGSRGDQEGANTSGIPRRINREKLLRSDFEKDLARPDSLRSRVFRGLTTLLKARRAAAAFDPWSSQQVVFFGPAVFGLLRGSREARQPVLCLHNLTAEDVRLDLAASGLSEFEDAPCLASNKSTGTAFLPKSGVMLAPYEFRWLSVGK